MIPGIGQTLGGIRENVWPIPGIVLTKSFCY